MQSDVIDLYEVMGELAGTVKVLLKLDRESGYPILPEIFRLEFEQSIARYDRWILQAFGMEGKSCQPSN